MLEIQQLTDVNVEKYVTIIKAAPAIRQCVTEQKKKNSKREEGIKCVEALLLRIAYYRPICAVLINRDRHCSAEKFALMYAIFRIDPSVCFFSESIALGAVILDRENA